MIKFDEDAYRDKQTNKYLDSLEEAEEDQLSNCCYAPMCENSDICCECKEHCVTVAEEKESAYDDAMDQKYEEMKDERMNSET